MKDLSAMRSDQAAFCAELRRTAGALAEEVASRFTTEAILLTGSVARGDARRSPWGLQVDVCVVSDSGNLDLAVALGPNTEPDIPFYCPVFQGVGFQIQQSSTSELFASGKTEATSFALAESSVLVSRDPLFAARLAEAYPRSQPPRRDAAMTAFWRFDYLTGDYRVEKWAYREAWPQVAQNFHEAFECFAQFVYALNGSFVPRKDWLVYLLAEQPNHPADQEQWVHEAFTTQPSRSDADRKSALFQQIGSWMTAQARSQGWL